jgi:uncharacterized damage-inducible protein DinB
MVYKTLQDFFNDWKFESEVMKKYLANLTDESLKQKVTPDGRDLGFITWHTVTTIGEITEKVGLKVNCPHYESDAPGSAAEITDAFSKASESLVNELKAHWTDETLQQEDDMYGETWKRGETLYNMLVHQVHHRGQMSILMRQAGLIVPGSYGPSKEEWASMGMEPMK